MKIAIAGIGYVGLANAILLALNNEVVAYDIDSYKVEMINKRISPSHDEYINEYLQKDLNICATTNYKDAFYEADYIVIATPTNYDDERKMFDTQLVEDVIVKAIGVNSYATLIIKSTVPVGYAQKMKKY